MLENNYTNIKGKAQYVFKYIIIKRKAQDSDVWLVTKKSNKEVIGEITPYYGWKRWIFYPFESTFYSWDCLENIMDVLKELENQDRILLQEITTREVTGRASSQD
jgi:hypothetical protein